MTALDALLEAFDDARHPRDFYGRWRRGSGPQHGRARWSVDPPLFMGHGLGAALDSPERRSARERQIAGAGNLERDWSHYFDTSAGGHEVLPVGDLRPKTVDDERSVLSAGRKMDQAKAGQLAKRGALKGERDAQGRVTITDGKATLEQLRRRGVSHAPVIISRRGL